MGLPAGGCSWHLDKVKLRSRHWKQAWRWSSTTLRLQQGEMQLVDRSTIWCCFLRAMRYDSQVLATSHHACCKGHVSCHPATCETYQTEHCSDWIVHQLSPPKKVERWRNVENLKVAPSFWYGESRNPRAWISWTMRWPSQHFRTGPRLGRLSVISDLFVHCQVKVH